MAATGRTETLASSKPIKFECQLSNQFTIKSMRIARLASAVRIY